LVVTRIRVHPGYGPFQVTAEKEKTE
jgi:hypothetical protein